MSGDEAIRDLALLALEATAPDVEAVIAAFAAALPVSLRTFVALEAAARIAAATLQRAPPDMRTSMVDGFCFRLRLATGTPDFGTPEPSSSRPH